MRTRKTMLASCLFMMLLGLTLTVPTLAQAGRGHHHHHGHGHHHHHHHDHGHHHHHLGGYNFVYTQPRVYYSQPYYPQPRYSYYPAVPVYSYPPNVMMGIGTGNMDFMIRF